MTTKFNQPELCLLKNWTDARLIEEGINAIRDKYIELIQAVIEKVRKNHRELDCVKRSFSRDGSRSLVAIGKEIWPKNRYGTPSGFFIEDLYLDNLTLPDTESPYKAVFIYDANPKEMDERVKKAATRLLGDAEAHNWQPSEYTNGGGIWSWLQPKEELFRLLLKNEAQDFIDCMADHFEQMAKFSAFIDEFVAGKKGRKSGRKK